MSYGKTPEAFLKRENHDPSRDWGNGGMKSDPTKKKKKRGERGDSFYRMGC